MTINAGMRRMNYTAAGRETRNKMYAIIRTALTSIDPEARPQEYADLAATMRIMDEVDTAEANAELEAGEIGTLVCERLGVEIDPDGTMRDLPCPRGVAGCDGQSCRWTCPCGCQNCHEVFCYQCGGGDPREE